MPKKITYLKAWLDDFWGIAVHELRQIFSDGGVLLIFLVAGLVYPLLYNVVYLNGILNDTPVAVVDMANSQHSRRYIREVDATREVVVEYKCATMEEARRLMEDRKVKGIIYFPGDFEENLSAGRTATVGVYCDMSSFLYYKNALMAVNHVMLDELDQIQIERYSAAGYTDGEIQSLVRPVEYEENNPYNNAFSYSYFLLSAILLIIVQQTMFYGMSLLAGTMRERNHSFASLPDRLSGHGVGRVVLGRGAAYWVLYMGIAAYIAYIVPAIFGIPQRGNYWEVMLLLLFYVTDCVFFSMAWSSVVTRRESVFVLFLFISPICVFLTGTSWPVTAFPGFWKAFSYIFPSTFGSQAFVNLSTAGGNLSTVHDQMVVMTIQTVVYYIIASVAIYIEGWVIKNKERIEETRDRIAARAGIDREEDVRIIRGE